MQWLVSILLIVGGSFFESYPNDVRQAIEFLSHHRELKEELGQHLTEEETLMAMAIVAPELSQFSKYEDKVQTRIMARMYVQQGRGNFSIGYFQMKPSFAEQIERVVAVDERLKKEYKELITKEKRRGKEDERKREERYDRLERLASLGWQTKYLSAFVAIVREWTKDIEFETDEEKVRYWATLYNAGIYRKPADIEKLQKVKQFPHWGRGYNYAAVAVEFYNHFKKEGLWKEKENNDDR